MVELMLPAGSDEIAWRLTLEDGSDRTGRVDFAALDRLDARAVEGRQLERRRLVLPDDLPLGYHRLAIDLDDRSMRLVSTPGKCWLPDARRIERSSRSIAKR